MSYSTNRYFDTQRWYENLMEKRTREAIRKKMLSFEAEHENDSDSMLLNAIRDRAKELGYVPYPAECIAYKLIIRRFGSWDKALRLAHLSRPVGARRLRETNLYRQEYRNQQKLHRREKEQKKRKRLAVAMERGQQREDVDIDEPLPSRIVSVAEAKDLDLL